MHIIFYSSCYSYKMVINSPFYYSLFIFSICIMVSSYTKIFVKNIQLCLTNIKLINGSSIFVQIDELAGCLSLCIQLCISYRIKLRAPLSRAGTTRQITSEKYLSML